MEIYIFCQRVYIRKQSSALMSRSRNEAWLTWCSTFSFNSLGYMFLNYVRNSVSPFIAQSVSMNFETPWNSNTLEDIFEMGVIFSDKWVNILRFQEINTGLV